MQAARSLPGQQRLRFGGIGDQSWGIPGASRHHGVRHGFAGDFFNGGNHLSHRRSGASPNVDGDASLPGRQMLKRSDVCAVPAAGVVAEAAAAFEIAAVLVEKFGGDSIEEMKRNYTSYEKHLRTRMEVEEEHGK